MRNFALLALTCSLTLLACETGSGESGETETSSTTTSSETNGSETSGETSSTETGTETTGETTTDTGGGPPLENGPSGPSVMNNNCAPDDGLAWEFTISLTSACDAAQPDPDQPFVRISVYDSELLANPVGTTIEWTDWQMASGLYAPAGQNGMSEQAVAGSFHIETWDGAPEVGTTITGWYTMSFESSEDIGGSFEATFCGGEIMCG